MRQFILQLDQIYTQQFTLQLMGNYCCQNEKQKPVTSQITRPKEQRKRITQSAQSKKQQPFSFVEKPKRQLTRHGPENYQSIKYLGKGTFGDVVLAQQKSTGKKYAMKIIDKSKIKQINVLQCELVQKVSAKSQLVSIKQTFQNQSKIYIVMEYLSKGDLYFYFKQKNFRFQESLIRQIMTQIITGIRVLHDFDIIYRELKPENLLVTNDGHIKLNDYGLSKMIVNESNSSSTYVGTLEYIAPEVITGHYGRKVDVWAIGVIMYQLKFGRTPFSSFLHANDPISKIEDTMKKINVQDILTAKKSEMKDEFYNCLVKLLEKDPEKRISLTQLMKDPWFANVDWKQVDERRNLPPLRDFLDNNDIMFRKPAEDDQKRSFFSTKPNSIKTNLHQFRNQQGVKNLE